VRLWVAGFLFCGALAFAKDSHVQVSPGKKLLLKPGETANAQIWLRIDPGFHVQANPAGNSQVIPTTLTNIAAPPGVVAGAPVYPKGEPYRLKGTTTDLSVYKGAVAIQVPMTVEESATALKRVAKGKLRYQACDDQICFFPQTVEIEIPVEIRTP
jgi:hypothetical protein